MGLNIEFIDPQVTREDIERYIAEKLIRFDPKLHELVKLPNGSNAIFVKNVSPPGLNVKVNGRDNRRPMIPAGLEVMYIYRTDIFDSPLKEGIYAYGSEIESMSVTRVKDTQVGKIKTSIEIRGINLERVDQAFNQLRSGKLKPEHDWSSPGTVEAPKNEKSEPKSEEGSGQHDLPPTATTPATQAA
ncbi:MAG TPA: hypothetical protein VMU11_02240 [Verrucomicrobiae bacterium]|nr:hypothetical protein [Verrucomicrobiae bacterium]